jgi:hypothetical protein
LICPPRNWKKGYSNYETTERSNSSSRAVSTRNLINQWTVTRGWYRFLRLTGRFNPCLFGYFQLFQGSFWRFTKGRTGFQVRNISDITSILLAIKDIDMIVAHFSLYRSPRSKPYYVNCSNDFSIRSRPSLMFSMEVAKDSLSKESAPNSPPGTTATRATSRK